MSADVGARDIQVQITKSPLGNFNGTIGMTCVGSPGTLDNYRVDDRVMIMMYASYNIRLGRIDSPALDMPKYIMGTFNSPNLTNVILDTIDTSGVEALRYFGRKVLSGLICHDDGRVEIVGESLVKSMWLPEGDGTYEEAQFDQAQNFHRQIIGMEPVNPAREHFGLYQGKDDDEKSTAVPGKRPVIYRRFVPGDDGLDKWVSTCEGTRQPFMGPNNDSAEVKDSNADVAFYKAIQSHGLRLTTEVGDKGQGFVKIRLDKVLTGEKSVPGDDQAMPAVLGNVFGIEIGEDGSVETRYGGQGLNQGNSYMASTTVDAKGNVSAFGVGKVTVAHSKDDIKKNSICLDPDQGIVLLSDKKLTFNGKQLVTEDLVKWIDQNKSTFCQVTSIGGPAPLHPTTLTAFTTAFKATDQSKSGYLSSGPSTQTLAKKILDSLMSVFSST